MRWKYASMGLVVVALGLVIWAVAQPPAPAQDKQPKGPALKPGRFQVHSAGLITAVLFDTETGQTWALATSGGSMMDGPGFMRGEPEFAWAPIAKFDDADSYKRWMKTQQEIRFKREMEERERQEKMFKERFKDKDGNFKEKKD